MNQNPMNDELLERSYILSEESYC